MGGLAGRSFCFLCSIDGHSRKFYFNCGHFIMRNVKRSLFFAIVLAMPLYAQRPHDFLDRSSQARSMTITRRGIVATSQTLASQAGAQILARGGSAVDAAIAANTVLGVVEPMMNGMGGDLFAIYWDAKTGKLTGLNSSGWAPQRLT